MKYSTFVAAAALVAHTTAKNVSPVRIDFDIYDSISDRGLVKRDDSMEMVLSNQKSFYMLTLYMGLANNTVKVLVDTGSLDLWVPLTDVSCISSSSSYKRSLTHTFDRLTRVSPANLPRDGDIIESDLELDDSSSDKFNRADDEAPQVTATPTPTLGEAAEPTEELEAKFGFFTYSTITIGGSGNGFSWGTDTATAASNTCLDYGLFATESLTSFKENTTTPAFEIAYADGTGASGIWGYDTVTIGSTEIKDLLFAVANRLSSDIGVLGIGFQSLETTYQDNILYQNLPAKLVADGIILKNAYSLYLNSRSALSGSILFGAIDHSKYTGSLQTVPIIGPEEALYYPDKNRIIVALSSLVFSSLSQNVSMLLTNYRALLDLGLTASYLPTLILESVGTTLGGTYSSSLGTYYVSCPSSSSNYNITFSFSGAKITVPYENLVYSSGSRCYLGFFEQSSLDYIVLGDNFLRSAYVVYDLEDSEVSFAQVNYSSSEDIEVISLLVPSATRAAAYLSTTVATGSVSGATAAASMTLGSSSTSGSSSSGGKTSGAGKFYVPTAFAFVAIVGAIALV